MFLQPQNPHAMSLNMLTPPYFFGNPYDVYRGAPPPNTSATIRTPRDTPPQLPSTPIRSAEPPAHPPPPLQPPR